MKALVFGANGQVGDALSKTLPQDLEAEFIERSACDLTYPDQIETTLERHKPDVVINAAAYTAVDKAESESELAHQINTLAPEAMARWTSSRPKRRDLNAVRFIHISTDFVFDGTRTEPYKPADTPNPTGAYARTKHEGETRVLNVAQDDAIIIRTSWVYSEHGNNFVKTMLRLMQEKDELGVVADQHGSPTYARGLAQIIWTALQGDLPGGVYHWSDAGHISWYDFAVAIQEEAINLGLLSRHIPVNAITTEEYPTPARRPAYSVLDTSKIETALGIAALPWRDQLRKMLSVVRD